MAASLLLRKNTPGGTTKRAGGYLNYYIFILFLSSQFCFLYVIDATDKFGHPLIIVATIDNELS